MVNHIDHKKVERVALLYIFSIMFFFFFNVQAFRILFHPFLSSSQDFQGHLTQAIFLNVVGHLSNCGVHWCELRSSLFFGLFYPRYEFYDRLLKIIKSTH